MKYTVVWQPQAERVLAELWLNTEDRQSLNSATEEIELQLKTRPEVAGEARSGGRRTLIVEPLGVDFEVHPDGRLVCVVAIWSLN